VEQLDQIASILALSMGIAWASGLNLYAAILTLGLLGYSGNLALPTDLQVLANPVVLFAAGAMYLIEFAADKVPGIDNAWDSLHTFIRIPAGAALAAGAVGAVDPAVTLAAALVGGSLAAGTHATKAGSRALINTSPEPFSNWAASLSEDALAVAGIWTALHYPWLFIVFLVMSILLMIWLLPKIWRGVSRLFTALRSLFRGDQPPTTKPWDVFKLTQPESTEKQENIQKHF